MRQKLLSFIKLSSACVISKVKFYTNVILIHEVQLLTGLISQLLDGSRHISKVLNTLKASQLMNLIPNCKQLNIFLFLFTYWYYGTGGWNRWYFAPQKHNMNSLVSFRIQTTLGHNAPFSQSYWAVWKFRPITMGRWPAVHVFAPFRFWGGILEKLPCQVV